MSARTIRQVGGDHPSSPVGFDCRMFGPFELHGRRQLPIKIKKVKALVAYLLLEGPTSRSKLAGLLWSEIDEDSARRNLRCRLFDARKTELKDALVSEGELLSLQGNWTSDVERFNQATLTGNFVQALELYRGEFLEGLDLGDATGFTEWLEQRRQDYARKYAQVLSELAEEASANHQHRRALELYAKLLEQDPFQERIYRQMMQLHALLGEYEQALERYAVCCEVLRRELGVEPLPDTTELAQQICKGEPLEVRTDSPTVDLGGLNPPLVGRALALSQLASSPAALTLILGQAGVGKSRLVQEFCSTRNCLWLRFPEESVQVPLYAVAEAIREQTQTKGLPNLEPAWRKEVERLIPDLSQSAGAGNETLNNSGRPEERLNFLEGLTQALLTLTGEGGVAYAIRAEPVPESGVAYAIRVEPVPEGGVLVLDGLHWADITSLELLAHLIRRTTHNAPVRLLATARPLELEGNLAAQRWLVALEREHQVERIGLEPLGEESVLELVQKMSGSSGGVLFAKRLYQATHGNPYFLLETLRYLFDTQELRVEVGVGWSTPYDDSTHSYEELPVPPNVKLAVMERVKRLGGASQRLLEVASLLGDGFQLEEIVPATALSDWEGLEGIEKAVAARLLHFANSGYRFQHDLTRRAITDSLSIERKHLMHVKLAQSLIILDGPPAKIAHHLEQSAQKSAPWRIKAAEVATKLFAYREALEHYRKALEEDLEAPQIYGVRLARIKLYRALFDRQAWHDELKLLEPLVQQIGDQQGMAEVAVEWSNYFHELGQYEPSLEQANRALAVVDLPPMLRARTLYCSGTTLQHLGRSEQAQEHLLEVLQIKQADPIYRIGALIMLTLVATNHKDYAAAATYIQTGLELAANLGLANHEAMALNTSARLAHVQGQAEKAISLLEEAIAKIQKIGDTRVLKSFIANLSRLYIESGQLSKARVLLEQGLAIIEEPRDPKSQSDFLHRLGDLHLRQGNLGQALQMYREAVLRIDEVGQTHQQHARRSKVVDLLLDLGDQERAAQIVQELMALGHAEYKTAENCQARLELTQGKAKDALKRIQTIFKRNVFYTPEERWAAADLLSQAKLARGDAAGALEALEECRPANKALLRLHLEALYQLGQPLDDVLAQAESALESGTMVPLQSLELRLSLIRVLPKEHPKVAKLRREARQQVEQLAASLEGYPELKASFLRKLPGL